MTLDSPAAARNADSILAVLTGVLEELASRNGSKGFAESGELRVLEIASGSGQHVERFATEFPQVRWQPTEPKDTHRAAIDLRIEAAGLNNVAPALALDAREAWPQERFDLVMAVNLVHISPWEVTEALIAKGAVALGGSGVLMLYGPYRQGGEHNSQGNVDFDADLRERDPRWGIRDIEAVVALASAAGLTDARIIEMPANNRILLLAA